MDARDWTGKVGQTWAREWQRTDRSFLALNARLIDRARAFVDAVSAPAILDIGCGAGATSLALHELVHGPHITGLDLSADLIEAATARASGLQNIAFMCGDASLWRGDTAYDLMISRHGVMFFADPVAAFTHLHSLGKSGGHVLFSCFRSIAENSWAANVAPMVERVLGAPLPPPVPHAPGPFAFADAHHVRQILTRAGFSDISAEVVDFPYVAGSGAEPVADAVDFFSRIGPFAPILRELPDDKHAMLLTLLTKMAAQHLVDDTVQFPAAAWIWSARI